MKGVIMSSLKFDLQKGDCLELMKDIPDGSVDLTVTSPPYDNLRSYNGNNELWNEQVWKDVIIELYRLTKDGGIVVWIVSDSTINGSETGTSFKQALWAMDCGFNLHDTMIWDKGACRFPSKVRYYDCFEYMLILTKGKISTVNQIEDKKNKWGNSPVHGTLRQKDGTTKDTLGKNKRVVKEFGVRFNVWQQPNVGIKNNPHPATFPLQLAVDHILSWSNENDTVLDCFSGINTTGIACLNTNRKFIGIELDDNYFDIGAERMRNYIKNE